MSTIPVEVKQAARLRNRRDLDDLDYKRSLRVIREKGYTQRSVADVLGISQPALAKQFRDIDAVTEPKPGFSGATPYEICQRYATGMIERAQLVDELVRWPYAPIDTTDGYDSLLVDPPGTWAEVERAFHRDVIDEGIYEEVFNRVTEG